MSSFSSPRLLNAATALLIASLSFSATSQIPPGWGVSARLSVTGFGFFGVSEGLEREKLGS